MPVAIKRDGAGVSSIVAGMAEGEAAEGTINSVSGSGLQETVVSVLRQTVLYLITWCIGLFDLPYTAQGCRVEDSLHTCSVVQ